MRKDDRQLTLPYQPHSETSKAAAAELEPAAASIRGMVLAYLRSCPDGATDEEVQDEMILNPSTQRPRRIELQRMGLVADSGKTRPTRSNRNAVVWIAVNKEG